MAFSASDRDIQCLSEIRISVDVLQADPFFEPSDVEIGESTADLPGSCRIVAVVGVDHQVRLGIDRLTDPLDEFDVCVQIASE